MRYWKYLFDFTDKLLGNDTKEGHQYGGYGKKDANGGANFHLELE